MRRSALYAELVTIRLVLAEADRRFRALTDGVEHARVETARDRIRACDEYAIRAAGGMSTATRTAFDCLVMAGVGWTVAAIVGQIVSPGWTVAITVIGVLTSFWPTLLLLNRLVRWVDERRTRIGTRTLEVTGSIDPVTDVVTLLEGARMVTARTMRHWMADHRYRAAAATAAGFSWLTGIDVVLHRLRIVEVCLCQAIDSIEIWREDVEAKR
jgi:hypothetical protein